ncbi:MAG: 50S ribosomal protein L3 [Elusimicrobiota bacterium]|nr:50S ribosomal protein L3 [Elusimicrobiota bacterium]
MDGIIGIKLGITRIFDDKGATIPATLIQAGPCPVVQIKTKDNDGYNAVQLAYGDNIKEKNIPKALIGHFKKANLKPFKYLKEFRIKSVVKPEGLQVGQEIKVDIFSAGDRVDISGFTKGKGFQGVVKRHNFAGGPRTHGQSDRLRAPGAIGSQRPQRVKKGTKMAGHMGNEWKTIQRLEVVKVLPEKNLLVVKGSIPGNNNSMVIVRKTSRPLKPKVVVEAERHIPKGKGKAPKVIEKKKK